MFTLVFITTRKKILLNNKVNVPKLCFYPYMGKRLVIGRYKMFVDLCRIKRKNNGNHVDSLVAFLNMPVGMTFNF